MIYLIGSLRNPDIPVIGNKLRAAGFDTFDDWFAAGPEADDKWREYEIQRGRSYVDALQGLAAGHVYDYDHEHLNRSSAGVLVLPTGKSGHLELGYLIGSGRPGYILLDQPDRWDVMYRFASGVYTDLDSLIARLQENERSEDRNRRSTDADDHLTRLRRGTEAVPGGLGSTGLFSGCPCSYCQSLVGGQRTTQPGTATTLGSGKVSR